MDGQHVKNVGKVLAKKKKDLEDFLQRVLKPELDDAINDEQSTQSAIQEYTELKCFISKRLLSRPSEIGTIQKHISNEGDVLKADPKSSLLLCDEAVVDLGYGMMFCRAEIKPDKLFVDVGLGFHVELELEESMIAIDSRIQFLERNVLQKKSERRAAVSQHFKESFDLLKAFENMSNV